jgi:predicted  nucleic acid-binding Zn-ribbon protein
MDVINSTARPRMRFAPTPHPRRIAEADEDTESEAPMEGMATPKPTTETALRFDTTSTESVVAQTPVPAPTLNKLSAFTPGARIFAGVTPRPRARARLSHPLAQAWTTTAAPSSASSEAAFDDRASVASSTSSHDLTTRPYARANASFDPVMGLAAQGHGVGKFNATKLNAYLHGLNRRLQQENEVLLNRLERLESERGSGSVGEAPSVGGDEASEKGRRVSAGSAGSFAKRRVSAGGSALGDVVEEDREKFEEMRAMLEEMVEELKEEVVKISAEKEETEQALEKCLAEKEEQGRVLDEETEARARDKERWKARMSEVEQGVSEIVKGLEAKVAGAEKKAEEEEEERKRAIRALERKLADVEDERDQAIHRAEKADVMLKQGKDLGGELGEANERVAQLSGELRNANAQIKDLEDDLMRAEHRIEGLEKDVKSGHQLAVELEEELATNVNEVKGLRQRLEVAEEAESELRQTKAYVAELQSDAGAAADRIEALERGIAASREKVAELEEALEEAGEKMDTLEEDAEKANELARQMEEALEAAEEKMGVDEQEIASLQAKISSLEREVERQRDESRLSADPSRSKPGVTEQQQAEIDALEDELDGANREIARLNTILNQSPARKAIDKAKDTKIEMLEKEKEELLERVKTLRSNASGMGTPSKLVNLSAISPAHRHALSMSIHFPKTPGGPLRDVSARCSGHSHHYLTFLPRVVNLAQSNNTRSFLRSIACRNCPTTS